MRWWARLVIRAAGTWEGCWGCWFSILVGPVVLPSSPHHSMGGRAWQRRSPLQIIPRSMAKPCPDSCLKIIAWALPWVLAIPKVWNSLPPGSKVPPPFSVKTSLGIHCHSSFPFFLFRCLYLSQLQVARRLPHTHHLNPFQITTTSGLIC